MSIYDFTDYKEYIRGWISQQPKKGRGLIRRMAEHLRISSTMLSHIFQGDKHLSVESAHELAEFMALHEEEFEYFLLLVLHGRAGSHGLQQRLHKKILVEQKKANQISKRIKAETDLSETAKNQFYANWLYTGVRNMTACPGFQDVDQIAQHLRLGRPVVQKVVDFLLYHNLCVVKDGQLVVGPQQTHLGNDSVLVSKHHQNWRMHGMSKMLEENERNLFFTAPMSLSRETAEQMRPLILAFIENLRKQVVPSPSEVVRCINIDWFEY